LAACHASKVPTLVRARPSASINLEDGLTLQLLNAFPDQPETMDMRDAVSGVIGPRRRWILAVPLSGGGSLTALS
jgi:hypothetical protein